MRTTNILKTFVIFLVVMAVVLAFAAIFFPNAEAADFNDSGFFFCEKKGSSTSCSVIRGIGYGEVNGQLLPFQTHDVSVSANIEGHGAFGPAGGKGKLTGCLSPNSSMQGAYCKTFFDIDVGDNFVGGISSNLNIANDFSAPYQFFVAEIYVNDATVNGSFDLAGRLVEINPSINYPLSVQQGQSFSVTWNVEYNSSDTILSGGAVSCSGSNGSASCTANSVGTGQIEIRATGASGNGLADVNETRQIEVTAAPPLPSTSLFNPFGTIRSTIPGSPSNTTCTKSGSQTCDVVLDYTTNSDVATARIRRNGDNWRDIVSNVSAGTQVDSNPSPGNYDYVLWGYSSNWENETKLASVKVTIYAPAPPPGQYNLTVNRGGSNGGNGTVTSSPAGINCGSDCDESYTSGTSVTLNADPDGTSTFDYWEGDCSGTNPTCNLTMDNNKSATALFKGSGGPQPGITCSLAFSPSSITNGQSTTATWNTNDADGKVPYSCTGNIGSGTLTSANGSTVVYPTTGNQTCALTVANSSGTTGTCQGSVSVTSPPQPGNYQLTVSRSGTGSGTVTSPPGINCGSDCSESYASGTSITLSAIPDGSSTFAGWSGDCGPSCVMNSNKNVVATFTSIPSISPPPGTYSISGVVFNDTNSNGTLNGGETGRPGVTVRLRDVEDTRDLAGPITTNSNGSYSYTGLSSGLYRIKMDVPSGCSRTNDNSVRYDVPPSRTYNFGLSCSVPPSSPPPPPPGSVSDSCTVNVSFPVPTVSSVSVTEPDYCVSGPAATVGWTYSDPSGSPQSAYQIQIDDQGSFNSPEADSGKIICGNCRSYFSGQSLLRFNKTYKARVRVWNSYDIVSNWTESGSWKTPSHAYPNVNAPYQFIWSPTNPAINSPAQFTDKTLFDPSSGNKQWSWTFVPAGGGSGSSTAQNPVYTFNSEGIYQVTEKVRDNAMPFGQYCTAPTQAVNIQKPIPIWKEIAPR